MVIPVDAWLDVMGREYLGGFIRQGGAAVRFVVAEAAVLDRATDGLRERAAACGLECVRVDVATVRLHMLQNVVFAVAAALPWEQLLQARLERLVAVLRSVPAGPEEGAGCRTRILEVARR